MRLLLVEDDQMLADGIKQGLTTAGGYVVDAVGSAEAALDALTSDEFDAAIIDVGLPGMDGMALTRRIRERGLNLPVLMLTARDSLQDRVQGLDVGADDYMVKPFELPELLARLRALLRRSQAATTSVLTLGPIALDTAAHQVTADGQPLDMGPREWTVLQYLMLHAPKPVSKEKLLQALTGWDKEITLNAVGVYISRLRAKLDPYGIAFLLFFGFGYRIEHNGH